MSQSNNETIWQSLLLGVRSDKTRLEVQLGITAFAVAYLYLWAFGSMLGLDLKLVPFDLFLKTPLISLAVFPLVFYGYVKADPLQRSHLGWQTVRFFQAQFPSLYIRDRCQKCRAQGTCRNFISPASGDHTTYWLRDLWRPYFRKEYPGEFENTFRRGYTCKLIFGTEVLVLVFFALGMATVICSETAQLIRAEISHQGFHNSLQVTEVVFLIGCLLVWLVLSRLNKPDATNPTGCWQAWREINRGHVCSAPL